MKSPKELGIDIAFGNSQRFGVPLWFGGPHPAYFSVRDDLIRFLPGRIIGKSTDINGKEGVNIKYQAEKQMN